MTRTLLLALFLAAACGGKKKAASENRDAGVRSPAAANVELRRCMLALDQAMALPPAERAGTVLRACRLCGPPWDHVLSADRADTGTPVDLEKVWETVEACGGTCSKSAATSFKAQLAELTTGKPSSRPWKALAKDCAAQLHIDDSSERFASGAWYALAMIGDKLHVARASMPTADQAELDTALASMLMPLPPVSAAGTGYIVPTGSQRMGTPWRHITVTGDAIFVGRLAFAHLSPHGLGVSDGGEPYPGKQLAGVAELPAALTAQTAAPPPPLADRVDEPVVIAPRAAAARAVTDALAALGTERAFLAVASPAPASMWRGLVAAHPLPLGARATLPGAPGPSADVAKRRVRLGLVTARVAIVDERGAVLASAPLPEPGKSLVQRWALAAIDLTAGQAVEIVAEDGKVDALAALLDVAAGNGAVIAVPAIGATLTGGTDLPAYDAASLKAALGPPGARTTP